MRLEATILALVSPTPPIINIVVAKASVGGEASWHEARVSPLALRELHSRGMTCQQDGDLCFLNGENLYVSGPKKGRFPGRLPSVTGKSRVEALGRKLVTPDIIWKSRWGT